jgi:hypothetical protein
MNLKPLDHNRLKLEEHVRRTFIVTLDKGTPREAIFDPGFWRHPRLIERSLCAKSWQGHFTAPLLCSPVIVRR